MSLTRAVAQFFPVALALLAGAATAHAQLSVEEVGGLSFTYQAGTQLPPDQYLHVNGAGTNFTVDQSQVPWVTIYQATDRSAVVSNVTQLTPPIVLGVQLNSASTYLLVMLMEAKELKTPGTYSGTIFVNQVPTVGTGIPVPMKLTVLGPPTGTLVVSPTAMSFTYQAGGPVPLAQRLSISSTAGPLSFNLSSSTTNGLPWLAAYPTGGYTPATATVSAVPVAGMGAGVYTAAVYVYVGGVLAQTVPVTLTISTIGTLTANPTYLTFSYQSGGAAPAPQTVTVVNALGGNVPYTVATSTTTGINWLATSVPGATTPSSFLVSVSPALLSPATYYGTISIYPVGTTLPSSQIPVTLIVNSANQLQLRPTNLSFSYTSGGANPPSQFISVTSTGAPIPFTAIVSALSWVTLSPTAGTTPTALTVNVNPPSGLAAGIYNANVLVTPAAGGSSVSVGVSVSVTSANFISVSQSSLTFNYTLGDANPAAQYVYVTSSSGPLRFDAITATAGFGPWLKATQSSQNTPATVTVETNPQGLAAGTYSGLISIVADSANNSPQSITVTLTVTKSPTFTANPSGMSFAFQIGQGDPPFQAAVISSQGTPLPFALSSSASSGGSWLLAAGSGTTPATVIAGISPNALAPGSYSGSLNVQPSDSTLLPTQVPVLLNVAAGPVFWPSTNQLSFQYQLNAAAPAPQKITIADSGGAAIVYYPTVKTGDGGTWLQASPSAAVSPSDVSVTVNPAGLSAGTYFGAVMLNDAAGVAPAAYVPVWLQVSSGPILTVAGQALTFTAKAGGTPPPVQQVAVGGGGNALSYHVDTSGGSWLQVTPTDGSTDAVLGVLASPAGMSAGYYLGVITISIPGVAGSEQHVPAVFIVQ
jgi:hypothetical protein